MKKRLGYLALAGILSISSLASAPTISVKAATNEYMIDNEELPEGESTNKDCKVSVSVSGYFTITLPKKITLAGSDGKSEYDVTVKGNIGARQRVTVTPDKKFNLSSNGKTDVETLVSQPKTVFSYSDLAKMNEDETENVGTTSKGAVEASKLSAGKWSGKFNFYIDTYEYSQIGVEATNKDNNEDLNASAYTIEGKEKEDLLEALVDANVSSEVSSVEDVDALIEVKSDDFDNLAETTFDVSDIAEEGDTVVILHYDEEKGEWEYIGTDTVTNGQVTADFTSYSPVAFVVVKDDGSQHNHSYIVTAEKEVSCTEDGVKVYTCDCGYSYEEVISKASGHNYVNNYCSVCNTQKSGLYDSNDMLLCTWEDSGIDIVSDYTYKTAKTNESAPYTVLSKYPSAVKVVIPGSITRIGEYAFYSCTGLTDIVISSGVTNIGNYAFYSCTGITNVSIPDSVTSIGDYAFKNCSSLSGELEIPNSVTSIGNDAFYECTSLTNVAIPSGVTVVDTRLFNGCSKLTSVVIPDSVVSIEQCAFQNCTSLANIVIPNSVTSIGDYAFYGCTSLTGEIVIPNGVTLIEEYTFSECTGINKIVIPDSVSSLGECAFANCTGLTSVDIPDSVTIIGMRAFMGCTSLTSVTIPSSVTSIDIYAFGGCTNLSNVDIPDSVTSIGNLAFSSVPHITYKGTATGSPWGAKSIN